MKQIGNTLFICSEDAYLRLKNGILSIERGDDHLGEFPGHMFCDIISFSNIAPSPQLMKWCADNGINLSFVDNYTHRFLARVTGQSRGNVFLRREQYRIADDPTRYISISRRMIFGKLHNCRYVLERAVRDHALRVDTDAIKTASGTIKSIMLELDTVTDPERLRGLEAVAASTYFGVMDELIFGEKPLFAFESRSRRPPLNPFNAMLSYGYGFMRSRCSSALESYGLDSFVGFLHRDRANRQSLALDLMEEFRPVMDRMVLSMVNNRQVKSSDFIFKDGGGCLLNDSGEGRRTFTKSYTQFMMSEIVHPYTGERTVWGLIPFVQAQMLAKCIRGDMPGGYVPFLWR